MSFPGQIRRGPMAADVFEKQFTRVHNGLFRDPRLSFKAKGIFGLISTHRDGFGISEASIAGCSTDKLASVRSGLKELIAFGYLQRTRVRDESGRLGRSEYFITDMPDGLVISVDPGWDGADEPDDDTPSSEPTCENHTQEVGVQKTSSEPTCDCPTLEKPRLENRIHKKTSVSKKTKPQEPPSPPSRADASAGVPRTSGGEESAPPAEPDSADAVGPGAGAPAQSSVARQIAYSVLEGRDPVRNARFEEIADRIGNALALGADPTLLAKYLTADLQGVRTAPGVILHRLAPEQLPITLFPPPGQADATAPNRLAWCGGCDPSTRLIEIEDPDLQQGGVRVARCPSCNPRAAHRTPPAF